MIPEFKIIRKIFFNHIGKMVREDVFFLKRCIFVVFIILWNLEKTLLPSI